MSRTTAPISTLIPILVCTFAVLVLSVMDAAMKALVIAVGVYNTILWRSFLATLIAGSIWAVGARVPPSRAVLRLHAWRAMVIAIVVLCFFWGLARLPLAEAIALSFVAPLIALYLAALMLGERIRRQAIWGSLAGTAGVVIIMAGQFGRASYTEAALAGTAAILFSTVFYAYNLVLMRRQALVARPIEISFFQNLSLTLLLCLAAPWLAIVLPRDLWLPLAGITALSLSGQLMMSWAYRRAEAQSLIPTEYSAFIWAIALGWFYFGEIVSWATFAGAGLIIAGCIIASRSGPRSAEPIEIAAI